MATSWSFHGLSGPSQDSQESPSILCNTAVWCQGRKDKEKCNHQYQLIISIIIILWTNEIIQKHSAIDSLGMFWYSFIQVGLISTRLKDACLTRCECYGPLDLHSMCLQFQGKQLSKQHKLSIPEHKTPDGWWLVRGNIPKILLIIIPGLGIHFFHQKKTIIAWMYQLNYPIFCLSNPMGEAL